MSNEDKTNNLADVLRELSSSFQEAAAEYEKQCDQYWDQLPYEDKLMAFYSVCKRIHKGDVKIGTTYRGVLYNVFDFGPDAYSIGMECGYMTLHNLIHDGKAKENDE